MIRRHLGHAGTVAVRVRHFLRGRADGLSRRLVELLAPWRDLDVEPPAAEADRLSEEAAALVREIVDEIEKAGAGHDRLGQAVRNLLECLGRAAEGAELSLRAGEDPKSPLRP
ncbi:MAG TPA: hypothetical protein VEJ18_06010 [Planctomycetota bacterium]|nr:hypothetical protein [Planctomycetota bacterium]